MGNVTSSGSTASPHNGCAATRPAIRDACAVLFLTMLEERDRLLAAVRAGARGYMVKGASRDEIVGAVTAVADGEAIFRAHVAGDLLGHGGAAPQPGAVELSGR